MFEKNRGRRQLASHDAICILNGSDEDTHINIFIFPYRSRSFGAVYIYSKSLAHMHVRFNEFTARAGAE